MGHFDLLYFILMGWGECSQKSYHFLTVSIPIAASLPLLLKGDCLQVNGLKSVQLKALGELS